MMTVFEPGWYSCVNTILEFQNRASTQLRAQTFKIRLDNESRVGTPLRRNLIIIKLNRNKILVPYDLKMKGVKQPWCEVSNLT